MPVQMHSMEQVASDAMPGNVVELHVTGKLHRADYQEFAPRLEKLLAEHGKLRLLVMITDFKGWDIGAMWEDLKLDVRHYSDFERIAVVGQHGEHHVLTDLFKPFTRAKVKYFDVDDLKEARRWIAE